MGKKRLHLHLPGLAFADAAAPEFTCALGCWPAGEAGMPSHFPSAWLQSPCAAACTWTGVTVEMARTRSLDISRTVSLIAAGRFSESCQEVFHTLSSPA